MSEKSAKPISLIQATYIIAFIFSIFTVSSFVKERTKEFNLSPAEHSRQKDFYVFHNAAKLLDEGKVETLYNKVEFRQILMKFKGSGDIGSWLYPPSFLPFIQWLSNFSYYNGYLLWLAVQLTMLILATRNYIFDSPLQTVIFLTSPIMLFNIRWCTTTPFIAALYIFAFKQLEKNKVAAGMLFGLATVKPSIAIFIPLMLFAMREYKALAVMLATSAFMILTSVILYGVEPWQVFFSPEAASSKTFLGNFHYNHNDMPNIFGALSVLKLSPDSKYFISLVAFIPALAAVYFICSRQDLTTLEKAFITLTITIIVTPYVIAYDMMILLVIFCGIFFSYIRENKLRLIDIGLLILLSVIHEYTFSWDRKQMPAMPLVLCAIVWYSLNRHKNWNPLVKT